MMDSVPGATRPGAMSLARLLKLTGPGKPHTGAHRTKRRRLEMRLLVSGEMIDAFV